MTAETTALRTDDIAADLARVDRVSRLLDTRYRVPGTVVRFGLDSVIGLIPGIGDTAMLLPSFWIMAVAHRHGVRKRVLAKMAGNAGLDYVVGSIPLAGDLFDLAFKSHRRNAALLHAALDRPEPAGPSPR